MICIPSNLQIENIITRIKNNDMNLQPNFQRGEVWSQSKQQKLIDSILREWTIPPIHVIRSEEGIDEVLDGQQRLAAIRDFVKGKFDINGNIQPFNKSIKNLHKLKYDELPADVRRRFLRYEISIITLRNYEPSEPAELFDRLNQPMKLTSAEQRNAYIGDTRNQIKAMVTDFEKAGAEKDTIGFSNSRLSYDEIISKFCYTIEIKTLRTKVVASNIADKYREDDKFSEESVNICKQTLNRFMSIVNSKTLDYKFSFNKATIFSWFVFIKQHNDLHDNCILQIMLTFEIIRDYLKGKRTLEDTRDYIKWYDQEKKIRPYLEVLINTFNQRASMGSTDALAIIYRDIILHIFSLIVTQKIDKMLLEFDKKAVDNLSNALEYIYETYNWGEVF